MERRGIKTGIGDKNREIQERNTEREMLHMKQKAVVMEIKRAELEAKGQGRSQTPAHLPKISPLMRGSDPVKVFYRETQNRRLDLLEGLNRQYEEQEQGAQQELTQLFNSVSQKGIFGFWRNITGRTQKDTEAIRRLQANLENIQKRKQEAFAAFEKDRQMRLETLKKEQKQEKITEQIPANDVVSQPPDRENEKLIAFLEQREREREISKNQNRGFER